MENNNNNGRGIFYGVIGVATLVVAIIGATFAYFSATVGQNDAINVASTTVELNMINIKRNLKTDLIPVDTLTTVYETDGSVKSNTPNENFYTFPGLTATGEGPGTCVDYVGNSICSVYEFTIQNPSTNPAQTVTGSLTTSANTGFTDLKYAVFRGAVDDIDEFDVNAEPATTVGAGDGTLVHKGSIPTGDQLATQGTHVWSLTKELLEPSDTVTYTVVVWLEDIEKNQDEQQNERFAAAITFSSDDGKGVTGVLVQ